MGRAVKSRRLSNTSACVSFDLSSSIEHSSIQLNTYAPHKSYNFTCVQTTINLLLVGSCALACELSRTRTKVTTLRVVVVGGWVWLNCCDTNTTTDTSNRDFFDPFIQSLSSTTYLQQPLSAQTNVSFNSLLHLIVLSILFDKSDLSSSTRKILTSKRNGCSRENERNRYV